jgi:hypothetical protein
LYGSEHEKQTERRRTVERVEYQAGAFPAVPVRINLQSGEIRLFEAPASRSPFPDVTIDRAAIRSMVDDHWRNVLSVSATGNLQLTAQLIKNFEDRMRDTTALMGQNKAKMFSLVVEEERKLVLNEFDRNPNLLKKRLGILSAAQPTPAIPYYQPQSIGEMAVRTAIQATIWETVIALFRR